MKLSNAQWWLLKNAMRDGGNYCMRIVPSMVEKSLRAKGALVHMYGNIYSISDEAKEAVTKVDELSAKYDRGYHDND